MHCSSTNSLTKIRMDLSLHLQQCSCKRPVLQIQHATQDFQKAGLQCMPPFLRRWGYVSLQNVVFEDDLIGKEAIILQRDLLGCGMSEDLVVDACACLCMQVVLNTFYVSLWITLSGTVILYNKWILAYYGFPYPITLTMWHMLFSSALAFLCVRTGYVPSVNMTADTYFRAVVPIGALFAGAQCRPSQL